MTTNAPKHTCTCGFKAKSKAGLLSHQRACKAIDKPIDESTAPVPSVNLSKALKLRLHNKLSYSQIANELKCPKSSVHKALKPFISLLANPEATKGYSEYKTDLITAAEVKILRKVVDNPTVKKASLNNAAYALQILNNMGRLERGESTSNIMNIHADLAAIKAQEQGSADSDVPDADEVIDGVK